MSVEGRILNKFDIRPCSENLENYGKLCRERTNKYMIKTRQIKVALYTKNLVFRDDVISLMLARFLFQVIENVTGNHMTPLPGVVVSGFNVRWFLFALL